jgi:hypothetical protein
MLRPFCPTLCISLALLLALPATGLAARQRSPSLTLEGVNAAGAAAIASPLCLLSHLQFKNLLPDLLKAAAQASNLIGHGGVQNHAELANSREALSATGACGCHVPVIEKDSTATHRPRRVATRYVSCTQVQH